MENFQDRCLDPDPVCPERLDPDPVCPERLDPDPVNISPDPQPCFMKYQNDIENKRIWQYFRKKLLKFPVL